MIRRSSLGAIPCTLFALVIAGLGGPPAPASDDEPEFPHGEFEEDCTLCHSDQGWVPAQISPKFDHAARGFELSGSHSRVDCRTCHGSLEFLKADGACASCHADVHRGELGIDCEVCHTPRSFIDRSQMYRRHVETRFPLAGTHRSVDCEDCHALDSRGSLQFVGTPLDCGACHLDDYLATTSPNHAAGEFPQSCESCHSSRTWEGARFSHDGLPAGAVCADCHIELYNGTSDPNHQAAGYPTQCELCHSTRVWVPAAFDGLNHDGQFFPIYSGSHRNRWGSCSDCHVTPNIFSEFNCLQCHAHDNQAEMANKHNEVQNYQYNSVACLDCHPDGRE